MVEEDGQLHTLGLLEQLRDQCKSLWGTSSELYFRVDKLLLLNFQDLCLSAEDRNNVAHRLTHYSTCER